ncbi:MAG: DUF2927 domain-containing protein [Sneathiella sp.]
MTSRSFLCGLVLLITSACAAPGDNLSNKPIASDDGSGQARASDSQIRNEVIDLTLYFLETRESGDDWIKYPVTKWDRPITYSVIGAYTPKQEAVIADHVELLTHQTSIEITRQGPIAKPVISDRLAKNSALVFDAGSDYIFSMRWGSQQLDFDTVTTIGYGREAFVYRSNLTVFFANAKVLGRLIQILGENSTANAMAQGSQPCIAISFPPRKAPAALTHPQNIVLGFVFIRSDLEEWMTTRCIHEEMTQVMGINNDLKGSDLTLFDEDLAGKKTELTALDKFVLRVLYDPRISPGMEGDELKETVTRIVDEKEPSALRKLIE